MTDDEYELRIKADENGATAEIVKIHKKSITAIGSVSTSSRTPLPLLRFQPVGKQPFSFSELRPSRKPLSARLKPSKVRVNLGIVATEWDLSSPTGLSQQEILERDKHESELLEHRKRLLRFYLVEFRNPARTHFRHVSFLRDFRYKNQILQHLKTGYAETGLYEAYTKWEPLEKKSNEDNDKLLKELRNGLKTIGEEHNVRPHVQGFVGNPVFYYEGEIMTTVLSKVGLPEWHGFRMRKMDGDVYYAESIDGTGAILGSANKPDDFANALNGLATRFQEGVVNLRSEISETAQLDIKFQEGVQSVLDDAELTYLRGTCEKCP